MNTFESFIKDVKENRTAEIRNVQSKGYSVNKNEYKFFDYFTITFFNEKFQFSLFATNNDTNYLIVDEDADQEESVVKKRSKYYSMIDLFDEIVSYDESDFCEALATKRFCVATIDYHGYLYELEVPEISKRTFSKLFKNETGLINLILLFSLIQNKSNVLFEKNPQFCNGIYRFFLSYSNHRYDNDCMKKRGWSVKDDKFFYKPYFPLSAIRIEYNGKDHMKKENEFYKKLKQCSDKEEALDLFVDEYNSIAHSKIEKDKLKENLFLFETTSDKIDKKEAKRCVNLKGYYNDPLKDRCYTKKAVSLGINKKSYMFVLDKFNKKYYLTETELNEIIKNDPSESFADGES